MKKNKKLVFIMAILSLLVTINMIQSTYAKYVSSTYGNASLNIAKWDIIVNDEHIKNHEELEAVIEPLYLDNPNVAAGVIAPGSIGYFDLKINPGETQVSFDYEINVEPDVDSSVTDLNIYQYYVDSSENIISVDETYEGIKGTINYSEIPTEQTVRVYVIWNDNEETENMNNEKDTEIGWDAVNQNATVKVSLKFKQKK